MDSTSKFQKLIFYNCLKYDLMHKYTITNFIYYKLWTETDLSDATEAELGKIGIFMLR